MALQENSRYLFRDKFQDECGNLFVDTHKKIDQRDFEDNSTVIIGQGDTLFNLAYRFYSGVFDRPAGLWWAIGLFNDIVDASKPLEVGRSLIIPSIQTLLEDILSVPDDFASGEIIEIET